MSDMIDAFRDMKDLRKLERERFGIPCPDCRDKLPRAQAKILLPGQTCRAHKPYYRDPRSHPTNQRWNEVMAGTGWTQEP